MNKSIRSHWNSVSPLILVARFLREFTSGQFLYQDLNLRMQLYTNLLVSLSLEQNEWIIVNINHVVQLQEEIMSRYASSDYQK